MLAAGGHPRFEVLGKGDASRPNPRWPGTATVVLCFSVGDKAGEKLLEKRLGCDVGPRNLGIVRFEADLKGESHRPQGQEVPRPQASPGGVARLSQPLSQQRHPGSEKGERDRKPS